MEKKMNITAICGWALPEDWFRQLVESYFPEARVRACHPRNPESADEAKALLEPQSDWVIGYSLGSLWLLHHKNKIPPQANVALLAPILAFTEEKNLGGKTPLGQLKYQKKMLKQSEDYNAAMRGFFDLSGIHLPEDDLQQPYGLDILIRGLEFLETTSVSPQSAEGCLALTGLRDPLLDGPHMKKLMPHLILVEDCDHSPHKLLSCLAQHPDLKKYGCNSPNQKTISQQVP